MDVTDDSFEQEVIKSDIPVLVDFWAEWCGPCKMLTPIINDLSKDLAGKIKIVKMNIEQNPEIPSSFHIRSIPTLMLFKDGQNIASKLGMLPKASIEEWIDSSLKFDHK
ncbi:MAG: thioredoxin [Rickettsiaceae bacterium]|nr:MAG: thioredoxin [Rickettsiaceae bacterium]